MKRSMMLRAATDREQRPYALQLGQSCLHGSQVPLNVPSCQPVYDLIEKQLRNYASTYKAEYSTTPATLSPKLGCVSLW